MLKTRNKQYNNTPSVFPLKNFKFSPIPRSHGYLSPSPEARVSNSEMQKSSAIMCWFALVWTFDFLADVIEFRGFFKINVKKSVAKQIEIIKKQ